MGIRITGVSTPIGGLEWEYTDDGNYELKQTIVPDKKISVFISSKCGDNGKYDNVRAKLKAAIEATNFANVYLFEDKGPSTMPAEDHYILALEDSDVCIFLIDNADGVPQGVQKEIDTANKHSIKSLYYFCDESQTEMTPLQKSLMGSKNAKSKTVHTFDELSSNGAAALVNEIIDVYRYYCHEKLVFNTQNRDFNMGEIGLDEEPHHNIPTIPKTVLKRIDRCKNYLLQLIFGSLGKHFPENEIETSEIDSWAEQFMTVLFEGKSIKDINISMLLEAMKEQQDDVYFRVVDTRWKAIQAYFNDDLPKCVEQLTEALRLAKESNQPIWVIQDILIDLRNQYLVLDSKNNRISESSAQRELDEIEENVHYPALDRIHESINEKYIKGLYKRQIESPNTVTFGNSFDGYGALLASSYMVSFYNGSLTHLLLLYERVSDFLFYLCCKYDDWRFRKDLLKMAIFAGRKNDVKGIRNSYPEVLNKMNAKEAAEIIDFCNNNPIKHNRFKSQLLAFGEIGHYLDEEEYSNREAIIIDNIYEWLNDEESTVEIGSYIFYCLSGIALRVSQDKLSSICCSFMEKHYRRWYTEMFEFMANSIDLNKMSEESSKKLIENIITIIEDPGDRKQLEHQPVFLYVFRKQNKELTETLDKSIKEYFPDFYEGAYKIETTQNPETDFENYIHRLLKRISDSNEKQGQNGCYFAHGTRDIAVIRFLLTRSEIVYDESTIDAIIETVSNTLLKSKEAIDVKLDAFSLMISIAIRNEADFGRNKSIFDSIIQSVDAIEDIDNTFMFSNIDKIALRIANILLSAAMGEDRYHELLEIMSYIQSDKATILSVEKLIIEYFENDDNTMLPKMIEVLVMQNVLQWIQADNLNIKWYAVRILLMLSRNLENKEIVNQKIINMVDSESVFIKNLILRRINTIQGLEESTREYVISKCREDAHYVVRKNCEELLERQSVSKAE